MNTEAPFNPPLNERLYSCGDCGLIFTSDEGTITSQSDTFTEFTCNDCVDI